MKIVILAPINCRSLCVLSLSDRKTLLVFLQGQSWRPKIWMQQRVSDFFKAAFGIEAQEEPIGAVK